MLAVRATILAGCDPYFLPEDFSVDERTEASASNATNLYVRHRSAQWAVSVPKHALIEAAPSRKTVKLYSVTCKPGMVSSVVQVECSTIEQVLETLREWISALAIIHGGASYAARLTDYDTAFEELGDRLNDVELDLAELRNHVEDNLSRIIDELFPSDPLQAAAEQLKMRTAVELAVRGGIATGPQHLAAYVVRFWLWAQETNPRVKLALATTSIATAVFMIMTTSWTFESGTLLAGGISGLLDHERKEPKQLEYDPTIGEEE